jgi:hypothetical protein
MYQSLRKFMHLVEPSTCGTTKHRRIEGRKILLVRTFSRPRKRISILFYGVTFRLPRCTASRLKLNDQLSRGSIGSSPKNLPTHKVFLPKFPVMFLSLPAAPVASILA